MNKSDLDIQTVEAYSVKEIEVYLKNILADTTIFIDIDETIIAPSSSSFRMAVDKDLIADIKVPQHFPNRDDIISSWRMQRKAILIDDSWADFIERFKKHKSVYGLTKMNSGKLGKIESLQKWRVEELAKFSN